MPTNESQLKYIILGFLECDDFHYPDTVNQIYDQVKQQYSHIDKAEGFLTGFDHQKIFGEIANR